MNITINQIPAHKIFINRYLDWELVQVRLLRYEHIRTAYPLDFLLTCSDSSPYYCHYIAWRLGTWKSENFFEYFNELLGFGASICNWAEKKSLLNSCSFDDFWGLIWELQVAKFFSNRGATSVSWMTSGPDLKIVDNDKSFYVECYTYRKSFAVEEFISELFLHIHPQIRVEHVSCLKFSLPRKGASEIECFLNELFKPYLIPGFLEGKLKESHVKYPVIMPKPEGTLNFCVYIEGEDVENYNPGIIVNATGPPELYLEHSITEALNNKRESNGLHKHHPNLLAINFLLGTDFQMAFNRQVYLKQEIPIPELGNEIDSVLLAVCGIDAPLSMHNVHLAIGQNHAISGLKGLKALFASNT
jgi:hypothetical protein